MKFIFDQKSFLKMLENSYKAVDSINIFLPLRNFFIETYENKLIIKTSNGNFSIQNSFIEKSEILEIKSLGKCLVPSTVFLNIIRKCENKIEIEKVNNVIYIKNNLDTYEINVLDATEYPSIDFELYGTKININSNKLKSAIKNVLFATSQKEDEVILNGVNLKLENQKLFITATDSYRLAQEIIDVNDDRNLFFDITVNNKNIKDFIPDNIEDEVVLYINDYKINLVYKNLITQSKIIDAPYKDVSNIFKKEFDKKLIINHSIFSNAISKATVITGDSYNKIRLQINKEQIIVTSIKDEIGNTKVVLMNDQYRYEGNEIIITLNFKYLKESINIFNEIVEVNMRNSQDIILITSKEKENSKQIISPLKSY